MGQKLLFLAGSTRKESLNKKLAKAAHAMAIEKGAQATWIDLKDYPMPIYNGDLESEEGLPEKGVALKELFLNHDGIFIASPEYNGSFSALLKNSLDWISRKQADDEPMLAAFYGKVFALTAASPGAYGGLRGLVPLTMLLNNIFAHVLPQQYAMSQAMEAFDDQGNLRRERDIESLSRVIDQLLLKTKQLSS